MATTTRPYPTGAAHTAGIYADLSVDGPVIGTLVAIVDRAKNLPNRKTIGKQDPYCAARLGKEAKKTTTDIRGGQTPKWDQELRFTVHDSSDYYQLKISIFTDDKRTDLVGEAWIDLKSIVVPGGGQADVWQSLSCKGKYAGEIRLEITYYDSRPKPDKPAPKVKQQASADMDSLRSRASPVKRRPLPSDPVTGEAPASAPIPVGTISASNPEYYGHQSTPARPGKMLHSGMIPAQSPLQAMEYNTPPQGARHQSVEGTSPGATAALSYSSTPSRNPHRSRDHYDTPPRQAADAPAYDFNDGPAQYGHVQTDRHELHMGPMPSLEDSQPPPPPPAHRSRHSSVGPESPSVSPTKPGPSTPMRRDVLKSEAHRHTVSTSSARLSYSHHDAPSSPLSPAGYGTPSPRHQSYDAGHGGRSLHATVEDVPDSPTAAIGSGYRNGHDSEDVYERGPSPGAYHVSSAQPSPGYHGQSPAYHGQSPRYASSQHDEQDYDHSYGTSPGHEYGASLSGASQHRQARHGRDYESAQSSRAPTYGVPAPPSSLQHTVDSRLARDVSERINHDRQYDPRLTGQPSPARGRQRSEPPPSYGGQTQSYVPPGARDGRGSSIVYSGGPQDIRPQDIQPPRSHHGRTMSASPAHSIPRKSVSPAPPSDSGGRLSDMPFGPDSYDALNPSMVSSRSSNSAMSGSHDRKDPRDPNSKIVMHDGREVDPSDHLPIESWAPEPEPKPGQITTADNARRSPGGAQPMPPSGRRQMRLSRTETAPMYQAEEPAHAPPPSSARNRLQKKAPRGSSMPPGTVSPLGPTHAENYQERQGGYGSQGRQHAHRGSYDYPSENYAPPQYGSGPPIPAKVPLMSGANGLADTSLMEEMSRIDIGNGRSRRRGGY